MSESRLRPRRRMAAAAAILAVAGVGLTACNGHDVPLAGSDPADDATASASAPQPKVRVNVENGTSEVPVDTALAVTVSNAKLDSVDVTSPEGALAGTLASNGYSWRADARLEPGTSYVVRSVAEGTDGKQVRRTSRFTTQDLTLAEQTYPSVAPLADETVGVGMPVIVTFDVPVTDKATFEKNLTVTSTPAQQGTWHWISDSEVHWRPATYWKPGTDVTVKADVNSIPAGDGIYGQLSRTSTFHVGDALISKVNAKTHQMKTFRNGTLIRTMPITTGKPGFTTRSGVKVIIEKFRKKRITPRPSASTGTARTPTTSTTSSTPCG